MKSLRDIGVEMGDCQKLGQDYLEVYEKYFATIRDAEFNMLEIGVFRGRSLYLWEQYFSKANLVGLDIDPACAQYMGGRKKVYIGSQDNETVLKRIAIENNPLSVIIDDGSHQWDHQKKTFEIAFPLLRPGGLYVIEDLHTSYVNKTWNVGDITGVNYTKTLVDDVMLHGKSFEGFAQARGMALNENEKWIEYIHYYRSICFIKKWEMPLN